MTPSRARTHSLLYLIIILAPLILVSCEEKAVDLNYPYTNNPTLVKNLSGVLTFVNEGGVWKDVSSENPEIANDPYFGASIALEQFDAITLLSETEWRSDILDTTLTYTKTGDKFVFSVHPTFILYAFGDDVGFSVDYVSTVSKTWDGLISQKTVGTYSYDSSQDIFTQLDYGPTALTHDTVAIQTFQVFYKLDF